MFTILLNVRDLDQEIDNRILVVLLTLKWNGFLHQIKRPTRLFMNRRSNQIKRQRKSMNQLRLLTYEVRLRSVENGTMIVLHPEVQFYPTTVAFRAINWAMEDLARLKFWTWVCLIRMLRLRCATYAVMNFKKAFYRTSTQNLSNTVHSSPVWCFIHDLVVLDRWIQQALNFVESEMARNRLRINFYD